MHIALIRRKYDLSGGAELSLRMLAEGFLNQGHQVSVLAESWQGGAPPGMRFCPVKAKAGSLSFARNALAQLRGIAPDICLSLERVPGVDYFRAGDGCHQAWLKHRGRYESFLKRLSFTVNPRHRVQLRLERELLGSPDLKLVIANSHMVAREISHYYAVPAHKITVIYNPVDNSRLNSAFDEQALKRAARALAIKEHEQQLLFLGSGFERKGLAFIIKALKYLPESVKLLVAGQGSTRVYRNLAASLGVARRVNFLGLYQRPGELLGLCHALVLPTIYDPCANVCLEALAVGKPVITTSSNGAGEFVRPGVNGFIVDEPADSRQLALACEQALAISGPVTAVLNTPGQWLEQINQALGTV